jgi:NADPH:quinone reductase-like Zn-dependent oxidoreductase
VRIIRYHCPGGPDVLQLDEIPPPQPCSGELLISVAAAGVSLPAVRAMFTASGPWPVAPGGEVAGRVIALGPDVTGWHLGQRVVSVAFGGAYAELAVVPAALSAAVPETIGEATAVALLRNGHVALGALRAGGLKSGEKVLITAAAGGVGHLAVQLARVLGAERVLAAVGSSGKEAFVRELGADAVLSYADTAAAWPETVNIVLDGAGQAALHRGVAALAPFGRLVSYSASGGIVQVNDLRSQARSIIGFTVAHLARYSPQHYAQHQEELWRLALDSQVRPAIHAELPLTDAQHAHQILLSRENLGKVVLLP